MGWSASGVMGQFLLDQFDPSDLSVDLTAEDGKLALWGSAVTPNFNSDLAYGTSPWNSGECSGAGYTAGGPTLTGTTLVASGGVLTFDADNVQLNGTTITSEGGLIYWPNKSNRAYAAIWWGAPKETQDGTFLITWHSSGIVVSDYTP
ncbi:hypothetical protein AB0C10_21355 [Microbispora amethystogenes]|uniref:hypothetical protein n=1 Tax=Microbispora amethystogenes TaxID=1427754 RepID=UPI0033CEA0D4